MRDKMKFGKIFLAVFVVLVAVLVLFLALRKHCEEVYVTFTFDDGYTDSIQALNVFEKYNSTATVFVITNLTEFENHALMSFDDLRMLKEKGWDIQSHGLSHPNLTGKSLKEVENELWLSKEILMINGFDSRAFAVPYGIYNDEIISLSKKYYSALRTVDYGRNNLRDDCYHLKSFMARNSTSLEDMERWVDETQKGEWAIIVLHHVGDEHEYGTSPENLNSLLNYTSKIAKIKTLSEMLDLKC
jgi:peptidoglycan/xylan/chitin deacetylase (PgdA/CDA1 family)